MWHYKGKMLEVLRRVKPLLFNQVPRLQSFSKMGNEVVTKKKNKEKASFKIVMGFIFKILACHF